MRISESDRAALEDILAFGAEARDLVARGKPAYDSDLMLRRAAQMICLNFGEAAKRLSPELVAGQADIRFTMMVALRDKVAHGYRVLDPQVIWDTMADAVPDDIAAIERLLGSG